MRTPAGPRTAAAGGWPAEAVAVWLLLLIGIGITALAHAAPAPFVLDWMAGDRAIWHMPRSDPPTVYLTFDDGPNPKTTPAVLDVLRREGVRATFFVIDAHLTEETVPILRRMFMENHAVGLHSDTRAYLLLSAVELARTLTDAASRIRELTGFAPCRLFRPHAGWRGGEMFDGLREIDYTLVGWGWMLWDFNWARPRTARATVNRVVRRARAGDIVVMHDGDESAPDRDQRETVEATRHLVPALRARGLQFGTICQPSP
jgi:peptidoglycan/xylan/chitin deacetylase (PgdA/CDA1 family)